MKFYETLRYIKEFSAYQVVAIRSDMNVIMYYFDFQTRYELKYTFCITWNDTKSFLYSEKMITKPSNSFHDRELSHFYLQNRHW